MPSLLTVDGFAGASRELAVALILNDEPIDSTGALADRVLPALIAAGWQADGEPPGRHHISWEIAGLLRPVEALVLIEPAPGDTQYRSGPLLLTDVGRAALTDGLGDRAHAPGTDPG